MRISDWSSDVCSSDLTTGKRKSQITAGDWNVTRIAHLDTDTRTLWFEGVGREPGNPYYVRYYKVGHAGGAVPRLTPDNRTAERRVGKECVRAWRSRWST